MAIIEEMRSADVWADSPVKCLELPIDSLPIIGAPPSDRDENHAQSFRPPGATPDHGERQVDLLSAY